MSNTPQFNEWVSRLNRHEQKINGIRTVYYLDESAPSKPLALLVHGIGGDYHGLAMLGYELRRKYRIVLVDMPGHGASATPRWFGIGSLQSWFESLVVCLKKSELAPDVIIAHSFGCEAVTGILGRKQDIKIIMINPVPTATRFYAEYSRFMQRVNFVWAALYNWYPLAVLRGITLLANRSRQALANVAWVSRTTHATSKQVQYQARLSHIVIANSGYQGIKAAPALVIAALGDTMAVERSSAELSSVLAGAQPYYLRGGHMLPIESPDVVAQTIIRSKII